MSSVTCNPLKQLTIQDGYLPVMIDFFSPSEKINTDPDYLIKLGTVLQNLTTLGYTLSPSIINKLQRLSSKNIEYFYDSIISDLKHAKADDLDMGNFVVYKNFPEEVLSKSYSEYWIAQIFMYVGLPCEYFQEEPKVRESLDLSNISLKVLQEPSSDMLVLPFYVNRLATKNVRWSDSEISAVKYIMGLNAHPQFDLDINAFGFNENAVWAMKLYIDSCKIKNIPIDFNLIKIHHPVDVLRLSSILNTDTEDRTALTSGFISTKRSYTRLQSKLIKSLLNRIGENEELLISGITVNKKGFKNLLSRIHVSSEQDTPCAKVYDLLYNNKVKSKNSALEVAFAEKEYSTIITLLNKEPGLFMRSLNRLYKVFGNKIIDEFKPHLSTLSFNQLVTLHNWIHYTVELNEKMVLPKAQFTKAQVIKSVNNWTNEDKDALASLVRQEIRSRAKKVFGEQGINVSADLRYVKIPQNNVGLMPYGRGTVFFIPEGTKTIRTSSFWQSPKGDCNYWADNGWIFSKKEPLKDRMDLMARNFATCDWNTVRVGDGAIFSGDPTSSNTNDNKACQLIDLNLDELRKSGFKEAYWSILSYNGINFNEFRELTAAIQFCDNPTEGELFEASRAELIFKINSNACVNYVVKLDLEKNTITYLDAALPSKINCASSNIEYSNIKRLETLSAQVENAVSVFDIMHSDENASEKSIPFLYSDKDIPIKAGTEAFVFKCENKNNSFKNITLHDLMERIN